MHVIHKITKTDKKRLIHSKSKYVYAVVSDFLSTLWADEFFRLNFVESAEEGEK